MRTAKNGARDALSVTPPESTDAQEITRKTAQPTTGGNGKGPTSLTENYKFGRTRKRSAKLRNIDETRALTGKLRAFGYDFGAIGELLLSPSSSASTKLIKDITRSWLRSRYWGDAMILSDTIDLPSPDSLPEWKRLPAEVAQFFKLMYVLNQPDAVFLTSRLDPSIGELALHSERGPCDWLAERIKRALSSIGLPTEHMTFNIEFAPKQAKTLHRLHIHGAICIPPDMRELAREKLKEVLAPAYVTHGRNDAVKIEEPRNATDIARYAPKEAQITEPRIQRIRGKKLGSSAHRASTSTTSGGRNTYQAMNKLLYGNQYSYAGMPDFS